MIPRMQIIQKFVLTTRFTPNDSRIRTRVRPLIVTYQKVKNIVDFIREDCDNARTSE